MSQTVAGTEDLAADYAHAVLRTQTALKSLGPAIASVHEPVSPALARAAQATENAWRRIEHGYGLYTSSQIAKLLGYGGNRTWANAQRSAGRLLGVRRGGAYRYPGFQVSPGGKLAPVMADLLSLARQHDWSDESLVLWLSSPSEHMPADRHPADLLHEDPGLVLQAARSAMQPSW